MPNDPKRLTPRVEIAPVAAMPQDAEWTRERVELLKRTVCKDASDEELQLFIWHAKRTGLDPLARQLYAIRRWDSRAKREIMQPQTSIDGLRLIADRSGKYEGQEGPYWCGEDGVWRDVWLSDEPPLAATVGVLKAGCREPFWSVSRYDEYVQTDRDGNPVSMWRKMPANQLAKTAEALSLRKAFPQEMSGIYSVEEMEQAETPEPMPPAPTKPWSTFAGMVKAFAELHGHLPPEQDHVYKDTLREFGVEHSNGFKNGKQALQCYETLLRKVLELERARLSPAEDAIQPEEAS